MKDCDKPRHRIVDDDSASNRSRREESDAQPGKATILKCKKSTKISTFNSRTLREDWRLEELVNCMKNYISIVGVQEHRRVTNEELKFAKVNNFHFITIPAWRNSSQAATGGVSIVLSSKAEKALRKVESVSSRIMKATFASNPETTIFVAYSPTNVSTTAEETESFYKDLRNAIDSTPQHNFLAILGDLNAKISSAHVKYAYNKRTNKNGNLLLELASEKSLCIVNTTFKKKEGKLWTYEGPKGDRHMIDYIPVNSKWKNSVKNTETYSSFESVGSDHRVVTMEVRLSLRVTKPPTPKKCYDWKLLRHDEKFRSSFKIELRNRYKQLYQEDSSTTEQYNALAGALVGALVGAASATLPLIRKGKEAWHSNNARVDDARKKITRLTRKYNIHTTKGIRKQLQEAKDDLQAVYKELEEQRMNEQIGQVESAFIARDTSKAWNIVNTLTNRKASTSGKLSGKRAEGRKKQWFEYFKNILGTPSEETMLKDVQPVLLNLGIVDTEFTIDEVQDAKKRLSEGKAAGEDGIMPEILKRCDIDDILLHFANKLLINREKPDQFTILNLKPIPKSGNLSDTGNYRGISLTSLVAKLINIMLLNCLRPKISPI